jgi:hypothetical protein
MFIKFDSEAGTFTMKGDIAVQLLKAMGHSGTVPSAILPADIPNALARLKAAVDADTRKSGQAVDEADEENRTEVPVSLRQRAFPLIDLLSRAAAKGTEVMWARQN